MTDLVTRLAPPLPILFLDEHVVVADKPAGLLVHRTRPGSGEDALLQRLRDQLGRRIHLVQRLDRHTSGVIACGLGPDDARRLPANLQAEDACKEYLVLAHGCSPLAFGCAEPLRDDKQVEREARTSVTRLAYLPETRASLLRARLHTGRYHQIRRHLAQRGHPVLGDPFYGKPRANRLLARHGLSRPFLHAWRLDVAHPRAGRLAAEAPLPAGLLDVLASLPDGERALAALG